MSRVAERAGLSAPAAGELVKVTLQALGRQLRAAHAAALADELPPTLSGWLGTGGNGPRGLPPLLEAVARGEAGSLSFAAEHAATVCQILAENLRPEALRALTEALPDDVAALFLPREERPFEHVRVDPSHRTLSEADSASSHPVFRSRAPDRAHSESVARSSDPHSDTKLSSARGLSQEREGQTLAEAHPRSGHR
jgi:uncharacterized protein (DUF2267 family)